MNACQESIFLAWKAVSDHAGRLMFLNVERTFNSVRSDPRYAELVRRLGFPS